MSVLETRGPAPLRELPPSPELQPLPEGLSSIEGVKPREPSVSQHTTSPMIGSPKDQVGLQSIQSVVVPEKPEGVIAPQLPEVQQQVVVPLVQQPVAKQAEGPNPFPAKKGAVDASDKSRADPAPPKAWSKEISQFATGEKSSRVWLGADESRVKELGKAFTSAVSKEPTDAGARSSLLSRMMRDGLSQPPLAYPGASPRAAQIRQATMVVHAVVAGIAGGKTSTTPKDLLLAVLRLPPADRELLLQADRMSGGKLVALLADAQSKNLSAHAPDADTTALYAVCRTKLGMADVGLMLDRADPSGESAKLLTSFVNHLDALDVSENVRVAFQTHLAFQTKIGDFTAPKATEGTWRQNFTADLISRFAALEETPKADIAKMLKGLPKADFMFTVGRALIKPREGDVRILQAAKEMIATKPNILGADSDAFAALLSKLERRSVDPEKFITELSLGKSVAEIATALDVAAQAKITEIAERFAPLVDRYVGLAKERLEFLRGTDTEAARLEKANLNAFIKEFEGREFDEAAISVLTQRFGLDVLDTIKFMTAKPDSADFPMIFRGATDTLRQMSTHIEAAVDPMVLRMGLTRFVPMLPTAGKDLESFHWVSSTVTDLIAVADEIRTKNPEFNLLGNPIIILDQSDGDGRNVDKNARWDRNDVYLKSLEAQYGESHGLKIVHVSMQQITAMIRGTGIEKLIDTTGMGNPGYGGARNISFLLGPVIADAAKNGVPLDTITPDNLMGLIKARSLGADATNLFMGDDTDYVRPGGMFAKVGLNALYDSEYYTAVSKRDGRDTTSVNPGNGRLESNEVGGGPDALFGKAFGNSKIDPRQRNPGMGCVSGGPRFCFDIPTGAEEGHHKAAVTHIDQFAVVSHLSGDRMKPLGRQVTDYLNYSIGTEMFKVLGDHPAITPWNQILAGALKTGSMPYNGLGEVYAKAAEPETLAAAQSEFVHYLGTMLNKKSDGPFGVQQSHVDAVTKLLADNPDMDPELRAEYEQVETAYQNVMRQSDVIADMGTRFMEALVPGFAKLGYAEMQSAAKAAVEAAGPDGIQAAFAQAKKAAVTDKGIALNDPKNQIVRDFTLIVESLGTGGFAALAAKFA